MHIEHGVTVVAATPGRSCVSPQPTTAVVVDDVALLRLGIATVLEAMGVDVVAETGCGRDVPRLVQECRAGIVVLGIVADLAPPEIVRRLKALDPPPVVVALMQRTHREELAALLSLDTEGLVVRSAGREELTLVLEHVVKGERVVSPVLLAALAGAVGPTELDPPDELRLTVREREVLALLAEGRANREIAGALFVTLATVKTHLAHIYTKLGARNRNEALGRAVELGLFA
ncbi:MAG: DNA-binding response regulator [Actinomycetia bacterium]|nr:DNA-binding response regulator [Actinomycetes bacterium]